MFTVVITINIIFPVIRFLIFAVNSMNTTINLGGKVPFVRCSIYIPTIQHISGSSGYFTFDIHIINCSIIIDTERKCLIVSKRVLPFRSVRNEHNPATLSFPFSVHSHICIAHGFFAEIKWYIAIRISIPSNESKSWAAVWRYIAGITA